MLNAASQERIIILCCIISVAFGAFNAYQVLKVKVNPVQEAEGDEENTRLTADISPKKLEEMEHIA